MSFYSCECGIKNLQIFLTVDKNTFYRFRIPPSSTKEMMYYYFFNLPSWNPSHSWDGKLYDFGCFPPISPLSLVNPSLPSFGKVALFCSKSCAPAYFFSVSSPTLFSAASWVHSSFTRGTSFPLSRTCFQVDASTQRREPGPTPALRRLVPCEESKSRNEVVKVAAMGLAEVQ